MAVISGQADLRPAESTTSSSLPLVAEPVRRVGLRQGSPTATEILRTRRLRTEGTPSAPYLLTELENIAAGQETEQSRHQTITLSGMS
jgi:hypothetical protein